MDFLLLFNHILLPDMVRYNVQNIISTVLYSDNTNSIPYYLLKSLLKPQILLLISTSCISQDCILLFCAHKFYVCMMSSLITFI